MANDNPRSRQPDHSEQETQKPVSSPEETSTRRAQWDAEEKETDTGRVPSSRALRLTAWLMAIVILLMILGWALGSGR